MEEITIEIYFDDLKEEKQKEILQAYGVDRLQKTNCPLLYLTVKRSLYSERKE